MIRETIMRYYEPTLNNSYHRYNSWENCYKYFRSRRLNTTRTISDLDCLHLGFYLASWGMYRGSGFLLGKSYEIHKTVIHELLDNKYKILWNIKIEKLKKDSKEFKLLFTLFDLLKDIYSNEIKDNKNVTDTLITKVLLGTMCCTPAYDKYFKDGCYRRKVHPYFNFTKKSYLGIVKYYNDNEEEFIKASKQISKLSKVKYPPMKLVDMYFWQIGKDNPRRNI